MRFLNCEEGEEFKKGKLLKANKQKKKKNYFQKEIKCLKKFKP